MNLFWANPRNMTALRHFESPHRFKTLPQSAKTAARFRGREAILPATADESFPLRENGHRVSIRTFAAPTALRPARFKVRGGCADRRRSVRWRRFPSDPRVEPHSDVRNVNLCRSFSGAAYAALVSNKRDRHRPSRRTYRRRSLRRII